jgi:hypothetical protein
VNIKAREIGRQLQITLGGPEDGMTDEEREIAERDVRRILIPPVAAKWGTQIFQLYARILFNTTEEAAEDEAERMSKIAAGAYWDEDTPPEEKARAEAQYAAIEALRQDEATTVMSIALYWNAQGGGLKVVEALLQDGHPKAQELLLVTNDLWNVYSRLKMLTRSQSSGEATEILERVGSSATSTPSGTSKSVERDAFGIKRTA